MQYSYALKLFDNKDFPTAIVEFNRFTHFFPDDKRVKEALLKKGISLFHTKRYQEASTVFNSLSAPLFDSLTNSSSETLYIKNNSIHLNSIEYNSVAIESIFMLSRTFLAMKRHSPAEMVLQDFLLLNDDPSTEDRILYCLVLIYIKKSVDNSISNDKALSSIAKAIEYIDKMTISGKENYKAEAIREQLLETLEVMNQKQKSPITAAIASIIPGGGFAYCNRYQDAIVAFLLNSAFILAAVESFEDGNDALGGLIAFIGSGFYGGSIYGGISSAHKYNRKIIRDSMNTVSDMYNSEDINLHGQKKSSGHKIPLLSIKIPF